MELHNDYSLALDEIEVRRKMFPDYQLKIFITSPLTMLKN